MSTDKANGATPRGDVSFDPQDVDDLIHSRIRLAAMAYIAGAGRADFVSVKRALKTSDGNLSVHLRKLEEAGYLGVEKRFVERRPQSVYWLTDAGREAWRAYLDQMQALVENARAELNE